MSETLESASGPARMAGTLLRGDNKRMVEFNLAGGGGGTVVVDVFIVESATPQAQDTALGMVSGTTFTVAHTIQEILDIIGSGG